MKTGPNIAPHRLSGRECNVVDLGDFYPSQEKLCAEYGVKYVPCMPGSIVGVSRNFGENIFPKNGLRHLPSLQSNGWFLWAGDFCYDNDFFQSVHLEHIVDILPEAAEFLGLGPGWRFLFHGSYKDVWYDEDLLKI
jgi:hypothetical protein